jgi:lipopolysaccharide transport system ATP-binding protein
MRARLAFALGVNLRPRTLLLDEVLAVGDAAFQRRCIDHLTTFLAEGGSLVLASHSAFQVQLVCSTALHLEAGRTVARGPVLDVLEGYLNASIETSVVEDSSHAPSGFAITGATVTGIEGGPVRTGEPAIATISYRSPERTAVRWGFAVWTADGQICIGGANDDVPVLLEAGDGTLVARLPSVPLRPGTYLVRSGFVDAEHGVPLAVEAWRRTGDRFVVESVRSKQALISRSTGELVALDVDWMR